MKAEAEGESHRVAGRLGRSRSPKPKVNHTLCFLVGPLLEVGDPLLLQQDPGLGAAEAVAAAALHQQVEPVLTSPKAGLVPVRVLAPRVGDGAEGLTLMFCSVLCYAILNCIVLLFTLSCTTVL